MIYSLRVPSTPKFISGNKLPPFSCSSRTTNALLLAGSNRFRFFAAGQASGASLSRLKHNKYATIKSTASIH